MSLDYERCCRCGRNYSIWDMVSKMNVGLVCSFCNTGTKDPKFLPKPTGTDAKDTDPQHVIATLTATIAQQQADLRTLAGAVERFVTDGASDCCPDCTFKLEVHIIARKVMEVEG